MPGGKEDRRLDVGNADSAFHLDRMEALAENAKIIMVRAAKEFGCMR